MAFTEAALIERVRGVILSLDFAEAGGFDFSRQPVGAIDRRFLVRYTGEVPIGGVGFYEEARGVLTIQVTRGIETDTQAAQQALNEDVRTILNAIIVDGARVSGEYSVSDEGR